MGCHFFSPGYLPDPGIERRSPALQADSLLSEQQGRSVIVEVVIVTANWGLTKDGELCKHFTCIIACNIHSSSPGINAIIPYLTGNKSWEGKGRGREKGRELLPSWQMERLKSVRRTSSTPGAPSTTPTVGISSNYGTSPVYQSLSCELSACVCMSNHRRCEWNCSLPSVSHCWPSFSSAISHLIQSTTLLALFTQCQLHCASCCTVWLYFSRYCAIDLKCFLYFFVFLMHYLCIKYDKLIIVPYYIANGVSYQG